MQDKHAGGDKRKLIMVLCVAAALVTVTLGFSAMGKKQHSGARSESTEEMMSSDGSVRTQEDCIVEQTYCFLPCGHTVTRRMKLPEGLTGADFGQVKNHYHQWQVEVFSPYSIVMTREEEIYCPMHLVLMTDETGRVCIFQNVYGDGLALVEKTDYAVEDFEETLRESLFAGLGFEKKEEIQAWLGENGGS